MISSMTAFAREATEAPWGSLVWEIRAVNHRYLELSVRLPEPLRALEMAVREKASQHLNRGKVDATLKFQPGQELPVELEVNGNLVEQIAKATAVVQGSFPDSKASLTSVLNWPGVLTTRETDLSAVNKATITLLDKTLKNMIEARQREGKALKTFIEERLVDVGTQLKLAQEGLPNALELQKKRIQERFKELSLSIEPERLEHELVWLTQKADIAEELKRLEVHVAEVQRILDEGGVVGRRLDFLMQELNREANTLGNKSLDMVISQASIEMKVLIEQMREQVQNIE